MHAKHMPLIHELYTFPHLETLMDQCVYVYVCVCVYVENLAPLGLKLGAPACKAFAPAL